jgi:hypothetical protein
MEIKLDFNYFDRGGTQKSTVELMSYHFRNPMLTSIQTVYIRDKLKAVKL